MGRHTPGNVPRPIIFDFKRKTVSYAGDPAIAKAVSEALAAQKGAVAMTGPGIARVAQQR
jgi:hypothetical protein